MFKRIAIIAGCWFGVMDSQAAPGGQVVLYDVSFKGAVIATQTVLIVHGDLEVEVESSFAADLMVFVAHHHIEERFKVRFDRKSGSVRYFESRIVDGMNWREIRGESGGDGSLEIRHTGPEGVRTGFVSRADYDINSLSLYVIDPAEIPVSNQTVRVLDLGRGEVLSSQLQSITESRTRERQHIPVTHLVWTRDHFISHTWHPRDLVVLPDPILREDELGTFEFRLAR